MASTSTSDNTLALDLDGAHGGVLDPHDGLDRLMGDRVLYARMLARFRNDYQQWMETLRAAMVAPDPTLAHRMAHTLKGASGMIGAHPLHWQACALERALRTQSGTQLEEANAIEPLLEALLCALDAMLGVKEGVLTTESGEG
jgi:HPt (histidine-containing phosphotransfer) domain-containing protein